MSNDRRTEPATPRRLRRARREGDHPVSRTLIGFGAFLGVVVFAPLAFDALHAEALRLLYEALRPGAEARVGGLALRVAWLVSPLVGTAALGALVLGMWQTGGVVSLRPLAWDWQRLSPWRVFSNSGGTRWLSLLSVVLSAALLGYAALHVLHDTGPALAASIGNVRAAAWVAVDLCRRLAWWALVVMFGAATLDAVGARLGWQARNRMSKDEIAREQRESDGDPALKQARHQAHRELLQSAEASRLAHASLLVVGPQKLCTALRYDPARDAAPRVTIQAMGAFAQTLEGLAAFYRVPVEHDSSLARSLAPLGVDEEIPRAQYADVARLLERIARSRPGNS